jgi:hypothetical protein
MSIGHRASGIGKVGLCFRLAALLAMPVLGGCQTHAVIDDSGAGLSSSSPGRLLKSDVALFRNEEHGKQTILLAAMPTGAKPPEPPPPMPGMSAKPPPAPMQYRAYLLLTVESGGGTWRVGQPSGAVDVRAIYYFYDETGRPTMLNDRDGTITTSVWPVGSIDPQEWWINGSFDLIMQGNRKLTGKFTARCAPLLVERFLRDRKL